MIRISKLADYAFVLLAHMGALHQETQKKTWTASDLAQSTSLPLPTVAKVLKILAKKEILLAQRGASGGYRLARALHDIIVVEVVEAMDGPIALTCCATEIKKKDCNGPSCPSNQACRVCSGWKKINAVLKNHLSTISLAEMAGLTEAMEMDSTA